MSSVLDSCSLLLLSCLAGDNARSILENTVGALETRPLCSRGTPITSAQMGAPSRSFTMAASESQPAALSVIRPFLSLSCDWNFLDLSVIFEPARFLLHFAVLWGMSPSSKDGASESIFSSDSLAFFFFFSFWEGKLLCCPCYIWWHQTEPGLPLNYPLETWREDTVYISNGGGGANVKHEDDFCILNGELTCHFSTCVNYRFRIHAPCGSSIKIY